MNKKLSLSLLEIEKNLKDFVFELEMGKVDEMFISNSFEIIEKALKALEIIKKKTLNINDLYWLKNGNYKKYRKNLELLYSRVEDEHLQKILKTKEEFDLLKEVLL